MGNDLLAEGTAGDDLIIISPTTGGLFLARINGTQFGPFAVPGIIRVVGDAGNDVIVLNSVSLNSNLDGGTGNDFIFGSLGNDTIIGGLGNDRINASGGNNVVWGDEQNQQAANTGGDDVISTLEGDDIVYGGGGNDQLYLGLGNDYAFGGFGNDLIGAGGGNDRIYGGAGNDVISGDAGDDLLVGNDGDDRLLGRTGRDVLIGGFGNDDLNGHEDVDLLLGRGTTNEASTTAGDANDLALTAALATWVNAAPLGLLTPVLAATDGGGDKLYGFTGSDRFYADQLDDLGDFNQQLMGPDFLEVFAGSVVLPPNTPVAPGTAALVGSDLVIQGTDLADRIIINAIDSLFFDVSINGMPFGPFNVPAGIVIINAGAGDDFVELRDSQIAVTVNGEEGNDYIATSGGDDTISGGPGDDRINAGGGNNTVWGDNRDEEHLPAGGHDTISTLGGNDIVYGGGGNDELYVGGGDDHAYGGFGDDLIGGGTGHDELYGGAGNDTISGDAGNDLIVGNDGDDTLLGRTGRDVLIGGLGADQISSHEDEDVLIGRGLTIDGSTTFGDANDVALFGLFQTWIADPAGSLGIFTPFLGADDNARDTLYGFTGDDDFYADIFDRWPDFRAAYMGNDRLVPFPGGAAMPPGSIVPPGAAALVGDDLVVQGTILGDTIVVSPAGGNTFKVSFNGTVFGDFFVPGNVIINGGDGDDHLQLVNSTISAIIDGGPGQDYIAGSLGDDTLIGGLGDDQINASGGDNVVYGDVVGQEDQNIGGNDTISTLDGNDVVYGGGGDDEIVLGAGDDYAFGGFGNDVLDGADGDDRLYGGAGNDILAGDNGHDLLVGNGGNDQLLGGTGRDVLIGGAGVDTANGGNDDDVIIGRALTNEASTQFNDANDAALAALLAQWVAATPANLFQPFLAANDGAKDKLTGGTGADDFYADLTDNVTDYKLNVDQRFLLI